MIFMVYNGNLPLKVILCLNFMDLVIYKEGNKLLTNLFEKPMALFLYLPPHSAHPPGVLIGMDSSLVKSSISFRSVPWKTK